MSEGKTKRNQKEQFRQLQRTNNQVNHIKVFFLLGVAFASMFRQVVVYLFFLCLALANSPGMAGEWAQKKEKRSTHLQKSNKKRPSVVSWYSYCCAFFPVGELFFARFVSRSEKESRKLMRIPSWNFDKVNKFSALLSFNVRCKFFSLREKRLTQFIVAQNQPCAWCALHNAIRLWLHHFLSPPLIFTAVAADSVSKKRLNNVINVIKCRLLNWKLQQHTTNARAPTSSGKILGHCYHSGE